MERLEDVAEITGLTGPLRCQLHTHEPYKVLKISDSANIRHKISMKYKLHVAFSVARIT